MATTSLFPQEMKTQNEMSLETIAAKLTYFQDQVKLLHWQTTSYSEHKALDKFYNFLQDIKDEIVEKMMGYLNRRVKAYKIEPLIDGIDCSLVTNNVILFAKQLQNYAASNNMPDIENIAQTLSGEAAKTKYLLTLS